MKKLLILLIGWHLSFSMFGQFKIEYPYRVENFVVIEDVWIEREVNNRFQRVQPTEAYKQNETYRVKFKMKAYDHPQRSHGSCAEGGVLYMKYNIRLDHARFKANGKNSIADYIGSDVNIWGEKQFAIPVVYGDDVEMIKGAAYKWIGPPHVIGQYPLQLKIEQIRMADGLRTSHFTKLVNRRPIIHRWEGLPIGQVTGLADGLGISEVVFQKSVRGRWMKVSPQEQTKINEYYRVGFKMANTGNSALHVLSILSIRINKNLYKFKNKSNVTNLNHGTEPWTSSPAGRSVVGGDKLEVKVFLMPGEESGWLFTEPFYRYQDTQSGTLYSLRSTLQMAYRGNTCWVFVNFTNINSDKINDGKWIKLLPR